MPSFSLENHKQTQWQLALAPRFAKITQSTVQKLAKSECTITTQFLIYVPCKNQITDSVPKLRAKVQRPVNLLSTDGTTSGDDGSETKNKQEVGMSCKFEQMLKPSNGSDLEADCEDNSYTDVDTVSLSGISNKNESNSAELAKTTEITIEMLHSKIVDLEKQLATVVQKNLKLTEENTKLKEMVTTSNK
ncbi:hypothetical protein M3Y97_00589400 [Aphelenchoides bicaudatus]|nr:hypothetical protein M3Y97_00589400 [Aphelenchoides bicaudatus]